MSFLVSLAMPEVVSYESVEMQTWHHLQSQENTGKTKTEPVAVWVKLVNMVVNLVVLVG